MTKEAGENGKHAFETAQAMNVAALLICRFILHIHSIKTSDSQFTSRSSEIICDAACSEVPSSHQDLAHQSLSLSQGRQQRLGPVQGQLQVLLWTHQLFPQGLRTDLLPAELGFLLGNLFWIFVAGSKLPCCNRNALLHAAHSIIFGEGDRI